MRSAKNHTTAIVRLDTASESETISHRIPGLEPASSESGTERYPWPGRRQRGASRPTDSRHPDRPVPAASPRLGGTGSYRTPPPSFPGVRLLFSPIPLLLLSKRRANAEGRNQNTAIESLCLFVFSFRRCLCRCLCPSVFVRPFVRRLGSQCLSVSDRDVSTRISHSIGERNAMEFSHYPLDSSPPCSFVAGCEQTRTIATMDRVIGIQLWVGPVCLTAINAAIAAALSLPSTLLSFRSSSSTLFSFRLSSLTSLLSFLSSSLPHSALFTFSLSNPLPPPFVHCSPAARHGRRG